MTTVNHHIWIYNHQIWIILYPKL